MFKLVLITALIASYGLLVASEEKVDDFDDWSSEIDTPAVSQDTPAAATINETPAVADQPKEPVSHIQKIPRRGEKPLTAVRKRRDAPPQEGPVKEKKRGNKNRQKESAVEIPNEGVPHEVNHEGSDPSAASVPRNGKNKKVRKPKASRKPKNEEQIQARKERKNKKDKTRKPKEGKQRQDRSRPTKVRKEKGQHKTDTNKQ